MKHLLLILGTAIVVLPCLAGARVQADAIHWSESATLLGPNLNPTDGKAHIYSQNFGVSSQIILEPGPTTNGTNSGTVVFAQLFPDIAPPNGGNGQFGGSSANYSLGLALHDNASGASGSLTISGNLSGWTSQILDNFNGLGDITNTFLGQTTQSLKLGQNMYTVTVGPYDPTGGGGTVGSISASIAVQPSVSSTPEPSSLLLACLGLPSLCLAGRFRRQHHRNNADNSVSKA